MIFFYLCPDNYENNQKMKTNPNYVSVQPNPTPAPLVLLHKLERLGKNQFIKRRHLRA